MKKKSIVSLVLATSLIAVIGVGSTLAYFTDNDSVSNVVTMGHVEIDLTEESPAADGTVVADEIDPNKGMEFENVMPGNVLSKKAVVTVATGSEDAYLRTKIVCQVPADSKITEDNLAALEVSISTQMEDNGWKKSTDGYWYYETGSVSAGNDVVLFTTVTVPASWTNNTTDQEFSIAISAEAIQADNFTPGENADGVYGWYSVADGVYTAITAETYGVN